MTLPPAEQLRASLGRFAVRGMLGTGGSSTVYDVTEALEPDRHYALKVLREDQPLSDVERRRFLDEAARMRKVEHPALVPLVEAGELPDGRPYLLMPRISGETLARRVSRGPLSIDEAVRHVCTLADGLAALHAAGMVHRDVKPENVVVQERPMLLDFGIAREIDGDSSTTTARGHVRGTPAYMAPERFFGAPASVSSDVYELGVVFYIMLTGHLPWSAEAYAAERLNPPSPEEAGVPRALSVACLRALCTRPEMRPESAMAFADAVRTAAAEPPEAARTTADLPVATLASPSANADVERAPDEGSALEAAPRDAVTESLRPSRRGWIAVALVFAAIVTLGTMRLRSSPPMPAVAAVSPPMYVATAPTIPATVHAETPAPLATGAAKNLPVRARPAPSGFASSPSPAPPVASARSIGDRYLEDRR